MESICNSGNDEGSFDGKRAERYFLFAQRAEDRILLRNLAGHVLYTREARLSQDTYVAWITSLRL